MHAEFQGIKFTDADVVNPDEYDTDNKRYGIRPYLIHDHGTCLAVVFARNESDALDEVVDDGAKLDHFQLDPTDGYVQLDYMEQKRDTGTGELYWDFREDANVAYLGNASEPFDIEGLGIVELPQVPFSFVALFNARPQ